MVRTSVSLHGFPRKALLALLEIWYVALRLLVQTWEEEEQLVLCWLEMHAQELELATCEIRTLPPAVKSIPRAPVYLLYRIPR